MSIPEQPRQPAGTPNGGQFTATTRTEPGIILTVDQSPLAVAGARLDESFREAVKLAERIKQVRERLAGARRHHLIAAGLPDGVTDQMFWSERVVAAEEDLADLQGLYDGTAVGLALLAERHDRAKRDVHAMGSGREPVDPESYAAAEQDLRRSMRTLEEVSDPDLEPVLAGEAVPGDLGHQWSEVGMVAAGVSDLDRAEPASWVVSLVDLPTRTEIGRVTIPNESLVDRLDRSTVVAYLRGAATDPQRADTLSEHMRTLAQGRVDPAA